MTSNSHTVVLNQYIVFQAVVSNEIWVLVIFRMFLYIFYQKILLMIEGTSVLQPRRSILPATGEEVSQHINF
jgi:hypothetical protein